MINFETANKDEIIKDAKLKARQYCLSGFHCSESIIRSLIEVLDLNVSNDVIKAACGFRGGGGGYHDRCGVIEVAIMIISLIYGRDNYDQDVYPYSYLIRLIHELFNEEFNSIYCRDILLPLKEKYQEHPCLSTYEKGIEIILNVLFDSEELLNNISIEDMNK